MKGILDNEGLLSVNRRGKWTAQWCPHLETARCGDWCPLFWESDDHPLILDCSDGKRGISIVEDLREKGPEKG